MCLLMKCLVLVQPQPPPSNLCVLMSMLGDGTATISTLKPVCAYVNASRWYNHNPNLERVCVCVCVWSCQFLEVEEWVKGLSTQL